jgi:hypothetical protein
MPGGQAGFRLARLCHYKQFAMLVIPILFTGDDERVLSSCGCVFDFCYQILLNIPLTLQPFTQITRHAEGGILFPGVHLGFTFTA